jgi:hypothetical protein
MMRQATRASTRRTMIKPVRRTINRMAAIKPWKKVDSQVSPVAGMPPSAGGVRRAGTGVPDAGVGVGVEVGVSVGVGVGVLVGVSVGVGLGVKVDVAGGRGVLVGAGGLVVAGGLGGGVLVGIGILVGTRVG